MKLWNIMACVPALIVTTLAVAAPNVVQSPVAPNWTDHLGGFITGGLGINLVRVSFDSDSAEGGAGISGEFELGYNFIQRLALVGGAGYYFDGFVWGVHAGIRGNLPVTNRISLTGDVGGAYLEAPATIGACGPYFGVGAAFAMSQQVDFNIMMNDVILSKVGITGNIVSALVGLTYHFNG